MEVIINMKLTITLLLCTLFSFTTSFTAERMRSVSYLGYHSTQSAPDCFAISIILGMFK